MYTLLSFSVLKKKNQGESHYGFKLQNLLMFFIHLLAYVVLYLQTEEIKILIFYLFQLFLLQAVIVLTGVIYPKINRLVLNNMCMLLAIGFIMLTRLSYDRAVRQFQMAAVSLVLAMVIPLLIRKCSFLQSLPWIYGGAGLLLLTVVAVFGDTSNGAKLFLKIGGFAFQPSEFVKIIFVFFLAGALWEKADFPRVAITAAAAGSHVVVLVVSKDLGSALIFFIGYVFMVLAATGNYLYLLAGAAGGSGAAFGAYRLFAHVRSRVLAWRDPWTHIDDQGYAITQSLFAIGSGSWFGMGLLRGNPMAIPYVEADFVFSSVCEELGVLFGICVILTSLSCFLERLNMAALIKDRFYQLIVYGIGIMYIFQIFLTASRSGSFSLRHS